MKSIRHYGKTARRYLNIFGLVGLYYLFVAVAFKSRWIVQASGRWAKGHPIFLRLNSSDIQVFEQVFVVEEYGVVDQLARTDGAIFDLGANIGLTSLYLGLKFPDKTILAVEPDLANFGLLCINVSGVDNVVPCNCAVWGDKAGRLFIPREGVSEWGRRTHTSKAAGAQEVKAVRVDELMAMNAVEAVSILKMDVEGAELNIFAKNPQAWIDRVQAIVVELHEDAAPGCTQVFKEAIADRFHEVASTRELTLVSRQ